MFRTIEGNLVSGDGNYVIVAARFNGFVVDSLVAAAVDTLLRHGVSDDNITVIKAPGAFELPLVVKKVLAEGNADAVIALGAVIRGATSHYDFVAGECSSGLARVATDSMTPVAFGLLTTESIEQAIERAGTKAGNKGTDAAMTAIEMVSLLAAIG
jgi:6,7-dimethyl-8-ribityllumazine synthase